MGLILQPNGWFPSNIPWAEYVGAHGPGSPDGAMGYGHGNQLVMHIWVYPEDLQTAIMDLLGINVVPDSTSNQINRQSPMRHPIFEWLYAERVTSIKPHELLDPSKGSFPGTIYGYETALYDRYLLSVLFTQPKFVILNDGTLDGLYGLYNPSTHMVDADGFIRQEWLRFLEGVPQGKVEVITLQQGTLSFRETSPTGGQGPDLANAKVLVPWRQFLAMNELKKVWHRVPLQGLLDDFGQGKAKGLDKCLQHVNAFNFLNYTAGTLKFEGYMIIPVESAVPPQFQNYPSIAGSPSLLADVILDFSIFDPPTDAKHHGHNNIIFGPNGKWYFASFDNPTITFNGTSITAVSPPITGAYGTNAVQLTGATVTQEQLGGVLVITGGSGFIPGTYEIIDIDIPNGTWVLDDDATLTSASGMTGTSYGQPIFPAIDFYKIFQMDMQP